MKNLVLDDWSEFSFQCFVALVGEGQLLLFLETKNLPFVGNRQN